MLTTWQVSLTAPGRAMGTRLAVAHSKSSAAEMALRKFREDHHLPSNVQVFASARMVQPVVGSKQR